MPTNKDINKIIQQNNYNNQALDTIVNQLEKLNNIKPIILMSKPP